MSDSNQTNDHSPPSFCKPVFYHIVAVGDPNYRMPEDRAEAIADPNRVIESRTVETPTGTHHYRVIRADITIRPRRRPASPAPEAEGPPATDQAGETPPGT